MGIGGRLIGWAESPEHGVESQLCHSPLRKALNGSECWFVHL